MSKNPCFVDKILYYYCVINIIGLMCFTGKVIIPDDVDETAVFFDLETTGLGTNLFI